MSPIIPSSVIDLHLHATVPLSSTTKEREEEGGGGGGRGAMICANNDQLAYTTIRRPTIAWSVRAGSMKFAHWSVHGWLQIAHDAHDTWTKLLGRDGATKIVQRMHAAAVRKCRNINNRSEKTSKRLTYQGDTLVRVPAPTPTRPTPPAIQGRPRSCPAASFHAGPNTPP